MKMYILNRGIDIIEKVIPYGFSVVSMKLHAVVESFIRYSLQSAILLTAGFFFFFTFCTMNFVLNIVSNVHVPFK